MPDLLYPCEQKKQQQQQLQTGCYLHFSKQILFYIELIQQQTNLPKLRLHYQQRQ